MDRVLQLYDKNFMFAEIAEQLGITEQEVMEILRRGVYQRSRAAFALKGTES